MDGIVFKYGGFTHRPCEVFCKLFAVQNLRGSNGFVWAKRVTMEIAGDLVGEDGAELDASEVSARIQLIEAAYANEYQDAAFFLPDGTTRPHWIDTDHSLNLTGNRIVYRSWEHLHPGELANTRSFSVRFEALFRDINNHVIEYQERTVKKGSGGPIWRLYETASGGIAKENITNFSKVVHITSGRVVSGIAIGPPAPLWPNEEQQWRREVEVGTPIDHGHPTGKFTHYETRWKYHFERLGPSPLTSNPRYP